MPKASSLLELRALCGLCVSNFLSPCLSSFLPFSRKGREGLVKVLVDFLKTYLSISAEACQGRNGGEWKVKSAQCTVRQEALDIRGLRF